MNRENTVRTGGGLIHRSLKIMEENEEGSLGQL